jgi:hypothetical protein
MRIRIKHDDITAFGALVSAAVAIVAALFSWDSSQTAHRALASSERINVETQRANLFEQFQEQYNAVSGQFPKRHLERTFRPAPGSDDYARLEHYWFFCFSEWYATNRVNPQASANLWRDYYTPLIADGLEIPSLRYVLEDRIRTRGAGRGDWRSYLRELARIAREDGHPLAPDVERAIFTG